MKQFKRGAVVIAAAAVWLSLEAWKVSVAATCGPPVALRYQVIRQIDRSKPGFTEGLIYRDGKLYESTGGYGTSGLNRIDPDTGQVDELGKLSQDQFGEGLESDGGNFYQLTWKEHLLQQWDSSGKLMQSTSYPYEGWGLTRNASQWISSDGGSDLYFFDGAYPSVSSFRLPIRNQARPETGLNELEFAEGSVFANVFRETRIDRIDPVSGCVTGELDLSALVASNGVDLTQNPEWVLNGIAYRPETGTFFITGKNWPSIYEVRVFSGDH